MIVLSLTIAEFLHHVEENQQRSWFILVLITHNHNPIELNQLLENHLLHAAPIHSIYLLFPDGLTFEDQYRQLLRDKFGWCRSYSDENIHENVRDVGRLTCHERISFYEKQRIQLEYALANNEPNIARSQLRFAMRQKSDHARLLADYLKALANQVDEDY